MVAYRFAATSVWLFASVSTLVVVLCYLIAQMVGAGALIRLLFGLDYWVAMVLVGGLMMVYVLFGGMAATTWYRLLGGAVADWCDFHGSHDHAQVRF